MAVVCCGALTATPSWSAAADAVVYAAGDIACSPASKTFNGGNGAPTSCRQKYTAELMVDGTFNAVLALGDLQYDNGALSDFQRSYNLSWGRVKPFTFPVIGNHEGYRATNGDGYCAYFGAAAHCNPMGVQGGAAFYSFNLGGWHVVVVNSNCNAAGGCDVGSAQYNWLKADLAANPRACTLAAWHHPRWSSGYGGNNELVQPIWQLLYANGGDLVLSGHSHHYERFAPIDANGAVNPGDGMRSFVVGTGGANFTPLGGSRVHGSELAQNTAFGLLRLVLHPTSYDWSFVPIAGSTFTDSGTQACRGPMPGTAGGGPPPGAAGTPAPRAPRGRLLARWRLKPASARRALARGRVRIPARRWARTVVRVRVGGRLAARRRLHVKHAVTVKLAPWSKQRHYRHRPVTVTIRRPL